MRRDTVNLNEFLAPGVGEAAVPAAEDTIVPAATAESLAERLWGAFVPGAVVSLYEAQLALRRDWQAAAAALAQLTVARRFVRVGEQLWVKTGAAADPYRLGARVTVPYCFAYGTALTLHTGEPVCSAEVLIGGVEPFESLQYDGVVYRHVGQWPDGAVVRIRRGAPADLGFDSGCALSAPESVMVTAAERTLVDCVARPDYAGGLDTLITAAAGLPRMDRVELNRWIHARRIPQLAGRVLWVLEQSGLRRRQPWLARDLRRDAEVRVELPARHRRA